MRYLGRALCLIGCFFCVLESGAQEVIVYGGSGPNRGSEEFAKVARYIDVIAPQTYKVDSLGNVSGGVPARLAKEARDAGTRMMPLIMNPGFDQEQMHGLLANAEAQQKTISFLVEEGLKNEYWGWQFDFENIHSSRKDAFTAFFRNTATALHDAGMTLSVAVVPTNDQAEERGFSRYMQDNWRGNFDMKALAEAGDFISLMTYAQHGGPTAPGPIAGLPWMKEMLDYALSEGVPVEKISLGIPFYSGYWYPDHFPNGTARVRGNEIGFDQATKLLEENGVEPIWVPEQGASYGFWQHYGVFRWVFLENLQSMRAKLDLFNAYPGLRGVSIWVLGAEDPLVWEALEALN
jgi:spore germination protein YaaH